MEWVPHRPLTDGGCLATHRFTVSSGCDLRVPCRARYVMKAILRVVVVAGAGITPYIETCIERLKSFLAELCKVPGNPGFSHHLFETIAALIASVCAEDSSRVRRLLRTL